MTVTVLGVALLAVALLSLSVYLATLHRLMSAPRRPGLVRTAVCRVIAAVLYALTAIATLLSHPVGPLIGLGVFTVVQIGWQVNSLLDVRLTDGVPRETPHTPRGACPGAGSPTATSATDDPQRGVEMPQLGLDYAGGRPGGNAITGAGYGFVVRYLSDGGPALPGKLLTATEYADLKAHGVAVVVNWETTSDRMKAGYQAGVSDARRADTQMRAVAHPATCPVYFSADWDATPGDQAEIDDYLRGCASVMGIDRVGVYGSYYVVKRCLDNHTATWAWQTAAWSGGQREPRAHLYQRIGYATVGGVECDVNEALQADYGQHPGGDDLDTNQAKQLNDIWHVLTDPMTSEVPGSTYTAPPREFWRNTDRASYVSEQAVYAIAKTVAAEHNLSIDDVKAIIDTELGKVVNVTVTVDQPSASKT